MRSIRTAWISSAIAATLAATSSAPGYSRKWILKCGVSMVSIPAAAGRPVTARKRPSRKRQTKTGCSRCQKVFIKFTPLPINLSTQGYLDLVLFRRLCIGDHVPRENPAVYFKLFHPVAAAVRVFHLNPEGFPPADPGHFETVPLRWDARVDDQAVVIRAHPQDVLGDRDKTPGGGPGQPGVAGPPEIIRVVNAGNELCINIGFHCVKIRPVVLGGRQE